MGCVFCATGLDGVVPQPHPGEIVEQMLQSAVALPADERLSHVVVMGMGEPLANLDALLPALAEAAARDGLGIGARRITISTVGLPGGIRRLAKENCQYHLAVSLHAANDALRNELVPANRGFGIAAILAAADEYFELTGRRVTFEYVLLAGVNDQPEHARQLVEAASRPAGAGEPDPLQSGARPALSHALAGRHGPDSSRSSTQGGLNVEHPPSQGRPDRRRLRAVAARKQWERSADRGSLAVTVLGYGGTALVGYEHHRIPPIGHYGPEVCSAALPVDHPSDTSHSAV